MNEQAAAGASQSKKRGVGFPLLSLRDAIDAVIAIGQHGASHTHDAAAAYMGHSTANSGAYRAKLAALRDYGLIERGDKDRLILTDLAQHLVLEAPDHENARPLLLNAFESCRVFGMLYHDSAKDMPQDLQRLRTNVVMRHGVASDQADKFLNSFVESVTYAGLGKFDGTKLTLVERDTAFKLDDSTEVAEEEAPTSAPVIAQLWEHQQRQNRLAEPEPTIPVALRQAWPIDGGEIEFVIRTPKVMPPAIYALMAKMAEVAVEMEALLKPQAVGLTPPGATVVDAAAYTDNI